MMLLKNGRIISADLDMIGSVAIENGKIVRLFAEGEALPTADELIDCTGLLIMPGLIDIHTHGAIGSDWSDGDIDGIVKMAKYKLTEGVTTLLPTTVTLLQEDLKKALSALREYSVKGEYGAKLPGVHLEGPYFNPEALGAQNPAFVQNVDADAVLELNKIYPVLRISMAPELPGAIEAIGKLVANNIKVGAGHSKATYEDIKLAMQAGLDQLCHFCNQMSPLHHREIGMVGAGLLEDDLFIEVIADKLHLSPPMVALAAKVKPCDRIILITDALRGAGMADGHYNLGGLDVTIENSIARVTATGAIAGGTTPMITILKNYVEISQLPLDQAIKCATSNPAKALGLTGIGRIESGFAADIVIATQDFQVVRTLVDGK